MRKILFIDRDGTIIQEPEDEQIDSLEKLEFLPGVFRNLYQLAKQLDYELVMVSNQDGLGTEVYPMQAFKLVQDKMLKALEGEGIVFSDILIDNSFPKDNKPTRKPGIGMVQKYLEEDFDLEKSFVIGDRVTDLELAKNMGIKGILLNPDIDETKVNKENTYYTRGNWNEITKVIQTEYRSFRVERKTNETGIKIDLSLSSKSNPEIDTGLRFFDHMLEQLGKHAEIALSVKVQGDLDIDEHHTIEDTAIALGEAFYEALGNKKGIERYGFLLPMDDCLAQVAIDFSGRPWLVWDAEFKREKVGDMPTEMFYHFFKSFSDTAKCNLNIKAEGKNEHHKIESIFKAFAKAIKMAVKQDLTSTQIPSTKGVL